MHRARLMDVLGIRLSSWDEPPSSDVYASEEPETTRV